MAFGGGTNNKLSGDSDVAFSNPADGDVLQYVVADGLWENKPTLKLAGDLGGTVTNPKVTGLQGNPVQASTPAANQVLQWNGTQWAPATVTTSGNVPDASSTTKGIMALSGDLGGANAASPKVTGLQGAAVSATVPASGQVLRYNGSSWTPTALPVADTSGTQGIVTLGGDLGGSGSTASSPTIGKIQGVAVNAAGSTNGQALVYNTTTGWSAGTPATAGASTLGVVKIGATGSDVGGTASVQKVVGLYSKTIDSTASTLASADNGKVLQWDGVNSKWMPATVVDANISATAAIQQSKISGLAASLAGKVSVSTFTAKGDVLIGTGNGTYGNLPVGADNYVLTADSTNTTYGVSWKPATGGGGGTGSGNIAVYNQSNSTVVASAATSLTVKGNGVVANTASWTGATSTDTQLTVNSSSTTQEGTVKLAGDLAGTAASPKVTGLQGSPVASTAPTAPTGNAVTTLTWSGTQWAPGAAYAKPSGGIPLVDLADTPVLATGGGQETINSIGATASPVSGTVTLNLANGNVQNVFLNGATTFAFTGGVSTKACSFTLVIHFQAASVPITWPTTVKWQDATAPSLTVASGNVSILTFFTVNGGSISWFGFLSGDNMS